MRRRNFSKPIPKPTTPWFQGGYKAAEEVPHKPKRLASLGEHLMARLEAGFTANPVIVQVSSEEDYQRVAQIARETGVPCDIRMIER